MQQEFWNQRWQQGEIGFHAAEVNPFLQRYAAQLAPGAIYVPMCGKSHDLTWLATQGFAVTGTEWIEQAGRDYFAEAALAPAEARLGPYLQLTAASRDVRILVGDAFALSTVVPSPALRLFDSVYDRASLVAIDPARRGEYAEVMHRVLRPGGTVLLVSFCYDQAVMSGPPWSVDDQAVQQVFGSRFSVRKLETQHAPVSPPMIAKGVREITEAAYLLTAM